MSVCFGEEWDVLIRGSKEDLEDVVTIADLVAEKGKQAEFGFNNKSIVKLAKQFHKSFQAADFQDISGKGIMSIKYSGYDGEHDAMEEFLFNFSHNLPQLEIAFKGVYIDLEYTNKSYVSYYYYAPGERISSISAHDFLNEHKATFPKERWIPEEWNYAGFSAPYSKAEGLLSFRGVWPNDLKEQIKKSLSSDIFLKTLKFIKPLPNEKTIFTVDGDNIYIKSGGVFDFGDACCYLDTFLKPFFAKCYKEYYSLCTEMFEKNLELELSLNSFDGANRKSWHYPNNSKWSYLITSDGKKLISKTLSCKTYSFGPSEGISCIDCVKILYSHMTGHDPRKLSEEYLLNLSIRYMLDVVKNGSLPDFYNYFNDEDDYDNIEDNINKKAIEKYINQKEKPLVELFERFSNEDGSIE